MFSQSRVQGFAPVAGPNPLIACTFYRALEKLPDKRVIIRE